ncbi:MAG: GxxExxY protein [Thermoguttaceae bacterium]|nr:GxxExxY protein [Thermoguttaceae bacterium]MBQ2621642.1 GxxExxY protein [Thermoguttaceae bacterium]
MHPLYNKASMLTEKIIGAAVDVHHHFGPGLLESIYVKCLEYELNLQGLKTKREVPVKIEYKGYTFDESLRLDLLVEDCVIIEAKAVDKDSENMEYYKAQILSYMKLLNIPLGLVINFHNPRLGDRGIRRVILKDADQPD